MFGKGKMKSSLEGFVMAAGKAAGNLKATKAKDAPHPIKPMKGAGRPAVARKKP